MSNRTCAKSAIELISSLPINVAAKYMTPFKDCFVYDSTWKSQNHHNTNEALLCHILRDNNNVPIATLWRQAIGRGHSRATLRSEPTTSTTTTNTMHIWQCIIYTRKIFQWATSNIHLDVHQVVAETSIIIQSTVLVPATELTTKVHMKHSKLLQYD